MQAMQTYYDTRHHKHPYPEDLAHIFGLLFGDDTMWCFDELIATANKVNVKAVALKNDTLTYRHNARWNFPFTVTGWFGAGQPGNTGGPGRDTLDLPTPCGRSNT